MQGGRKIPTDRLGRIMKCLLLYVLVPLLGLILLSGQISDAVRASDSAAFLILLAALGCVCLNWIIYAAIRQRRPTQLVLANGVLDLLAVAVIENEALVGTLRYSLASTLAVIAGSLALILMFLLSFRLASCRSKAAHSAAIVLRVLIGLVSVHMAYHVFRDIEGRIVTRDTWISLGILVALIPAAFSRRIHAAFRGAAARRRATGMTAGTIRQVVGITRLDRDDDLITDYYACVQYTVNGAVYETRTGVTRFALWKFTREKLIAREIAVQYDPENPEHAYVRRIDRHFPIPDEDDGEQK